MSSHKKKKPNSPYWEWAGEHCSPDDTGKVLEPKEANPDVMPAAEQEEQPDELRAAIKVVTGAGLRCLTTRQYQMYDLVVNRGFKVGRAARILGISRQAATEHLRTAGEKLREKCEKELRRMHDKA